MRKRTTARTAVTKAPGKADYGVDQDGRTIEKGDTVIELRNGVPWIYTAGCEPKRPAAPTRRRRSRAGAPRDARNRLHES